MINNFLFFTKNQNRIYLNWQKLVVLLVFPASLFVYVLNIQGFVFCFFVVYFIGILHFSTFILNLLFYFDNSLFYVHMYIKHKEYKLLLFKRSTLAQGCELQ